MEIWLNKNLRQLLVGYLQQNFYGRGYCIFLFEKAYRGLIFRSSPYFITPRERYLNQWILGVPSIVIVWVKLPYLPLHYWTDEYLLAIEKSLGHYINKSVPKTMMFVCDCTCIEVHLEKGFPKEVKFKMGGSTHFHKLDYKYIHFKCKGLHEYGHFSRNCPNPIPPYKSIMK